MAISMRDCIRDCIRDTMLCAGRVTLLLACFVMAWNQFHSLVADKPESETRSSVPVVEMDPYVRGVSIALQLLVFICGVGSVISRDHVCSKMFATFITILALLEDFSVLEGLSTLKNKRDKEDVLMHRLTMTIVYLSLASVALLMAKPKYNFFEIALLYLASKQNST